MTCAACAICALLLLQHGSLCFLQLRMSAQEGILLLPQALQHCSPCSLSAELEAAHLCNRGVLPGGKQAEVAGLVLAVMAERCLGTASRSAQGHPLSSAAGTSWRL